MNNQQLFKAVKDEPFLHDLKWRDFYNANNDKDLEMLDKSDGALSGRVSSLTKIIWVILKNEKIEKMKDRINAISEEIIIAEEKDNRGKVIQLYLEQDNLSREVWGTK